MHRGTSARGSACEYIPQFAAQKPGDSRTPDDLIDELIAD